MNDNFEREQNNFCFDRLKKKTRNGLFTIDEQTK